jgi:diacylglycerol kinase (ATP)
MTAATHAPTTVDTRPGDLLLIANPAAGAYSAELIDRVTESLSAGDRRVRTVHTSAAGDAAEAAARAVGPGGPDVVVVIGGDGTVAEVCGALADVPVGPAVLILPGGSGNSTARNVWGDRTIDQILDAVAGGAFRTRRLDLLRLVEPDVTVPLGVSTGFLAQVLIAARAVDPAVRGIDRYFAAAGSVIAAMPTHPTRVSVDGAVVFEGDACSVTVGGGRYRARRFAFLPHSVLDDGLLDVSVIGALTATQTQQLLPLVMTGQHLSQPGVSYHRGSTVVIERLDGRPLVAEYDGTVWDAAGTTITTQIRPQSISVIAPPTPPCG